MKYFAIFLLGKLLQKCHGNYFKMNQFYIKINCITNKMKVRLLTKTAKQPIRSKFGFDIFSDNDDLYDIKTGTVLQIKTSLKIEITDGFTAIIYIDNNFAKQHGFILLGNLVQNYEELHITMYKLFDSDNCHIKCGDKIGYILIHQLHKQHVSLVAELIPHTSQPNNFMTDIIDESFEQNIQNNDEIDNDKIDQLRQSATDLIFDEYNDDTYNPKFKNVDQDEQKRKVHDMTCFFDQKGNCHPSHTMGQLFNDKIFVCYNHRNMSNSMFAKLNKALVQ